MNATTLELLRQQRQAANRIARLEVLESAPFGMDTSFPASPFTGQRFYRNDLWLETIYNGTFWHAAWPHWVMPDELSAVGIGNWNFNRRYSTTFFDNSPQLFPLTAQGTPTQGTLNDPRAIYLTLNGSSQYLSTTQAAFGNFSTASGCLWFYATTVGVQQMLMSDDNNVTRGWALYVTSGNTLAFSGSAASTGGGTAILANTWYLGFFVYSGGNVELYLYTTSTESVEKTPTAIAIGVYTGEFDVGRRNHTTPNYFTGRVAAPKFWLGTLTALQREYIALCEIAIVKG